MGIRFFCRGAEKLESVFRKKTKKEVLEQLDRKIEELHLRVEKVKIPSSTTSESKKARLGRRR